MQNCSIVIGSLWGDEGKGHMTDILCNTLNTLNVRFNGGAQASHTVVTPDGKRHAFRHFGAGTFAGATTYLSEHFIVNMPAFVKERNELCDEFAMSPTVFVNPECIVTTPWDVYINQAIESKRGINRHGSCGFGINETVVRSRNEQYKITVCDLLFKEELVTKLTAIRDEYVHLRLKEEYNTTVDKLPKKYAKLLSDEKNIDMFLFYAEEFLRNVKILGDCVLRRFSNVVFEGAQGLLLDQNNVEYFPHVTTSNTGIKNVMDILTKNNYHGNVDIYYMSRCYMTKHGAGPLKNEVFNKPYCKVEDLTNVTNEFQGQLRYSYLDFDILTKEIVKDLTNLRVKANVNVVLTCLDQLEDRFKFVDNGFTKTIKSKHTCDTAFRIFESGIPNFNKLFMTKGLTRNDFESYNKSDLC